MFFAVSICIVLGLLILGTITTTRSTSSYRVDAGARNLRMWTAHGAFATTDTSGVFTLPAFMVTGRIVAVIPFYAGTAAAADGPLHCTNTITNGYYVPGTGGTLTIARAAGTTSAAKIGVLVISE